MFLREARWKTECRLVSDSVYGLGQVKVCTTRLPWSGLHKVDGRTHLAHEPFTTLRSLPPLPDWWRATCVLWAWRARGRPGHTQVRINPWQVAELWSVDPSRQHAGALVWAGRGWSFDRWRLGTNGVLGALLGLLSVQLLETRVPRVKISLD